MATHQRYQRRQPFGLHYCAHPRFTIKSTVTDTICKNVIYGKHYSLKLDYFTRLPSQLDEATISMCFYFLYKDITFDAGWSRYI